MLCGRGERDMNLLRLIPNLLDFSCRFPCLARSRKSWNHSESLWQRNKSKLMQIYLKAYFADAFSPIGVISKRFSLAFAYVSIEYPKKIKFEFKWCRQSFHKFTFNQQALSDRISSLWDFLRKTLQSSWSEKGIQFSCFQNSISFSCNLNFKISFSTLLFQFVEKLPPELLFPLNVQPSLNN